MTQIFVAVPLMILEEHIESSRIIKQLVRKVNQSIEIQHVFWTHYNVRNSNQIHEQSLPNKCVVQLASAIQPNYPELIQKMQKVQKLENALTNIKQDLRQLMKDYQEAKSQNKKLSKKINQIQKENSVFAKSLTLNCKDDSLKDKSVSILSKQKSPMAEEPLSISLEVNSKINSENQKSHYTPNQTQDPYCQNISKSTIKSLEKQISNLTRQNLQLKSTIIYFESKLLFVGEYLKKIEEEKEKELNQNKDSKKQRKIKD